MGNRVEGRSTGPKCVAIVGPFGSGKTSLFEALLARAGAIKSQETVGSGNTVGDFSAEAKEHGMSVEASFATAGFMGESITFVDCPGSIEFSCEAGPVVAAADLAIVVAEADEKKVPALQLVMRELDRAGIPRMLFLNKIDKSGMGVRDALKLLQPACSRPLLLRQIPIWKDGAAVGAIDLALERAYIWRAHAPSEIAEIPTEDRAREVEARFSMLETLADHDDMLMEQLLEDVVPPRDEVFDDLVADLRAGEVTPVFIGSALNGNGVLRLLKALRHEAPDVAATVRRLGLAPGGATVVQIMKTIHTSHAGKLSIARVLSGTVADGADLHGSSGAISKVSGVFAMMGKDVAKRGPASAGETVGLGKLDAAATGATLTSEKGGRPDLAIPVVPQPVFAVSVRPKERKDEVKLSAALTRLADEDPSLMIEQSQETGETILHGHGEMHLRVTLERLQGKNQIAVDIAPPTVAYRETIRKAVNQRGRHKKQSGGHGQFGDVVIDIKPLPRGSGFVFSESITGGVVPRQYFSSVETGVRDFLSCGPLGFPVVDLAVNLADGSYHSVDSSDMAFQQAARLAMKEGLAACSPVLLEPVMKVTVNTPSEATAKVTAMVPQRRGQILGFNPRADWPGWDQVEAMIPAAEIGDLIIELRSATAGVASYTSVFDHMAELTGRLADEVLQKRQSGTMAAAG
jgi:elongation factor G